ncbi:GCN5-related N-acetyltransferase [Desulfamplus magnetovallimortis]|uniref:GCN5-related N-acetyltransferase n=1 Tax=Desulfamplus magnetovallimortis TaxID=1246637 RepID=A0A1W1H5I6_9BACT|nr:GNAT family N-acetyltransferase [Desulfamplus magnetovallimortis]SLM27707.1 GCN5-related N-acetyltransferase [Desulfamplus magnetovallimortis]
MKTINRSNWQEHLTTPEKVLDRIKPGMTIFLGTGPASPRTLIRVLLDYDEHNLRDIELVQLAVMGDIVLSVEKLNAPNYRLKTFFSGFVAWDTISSGQVDLIPAYSSEIPKILKSRKIVIDVAFIQITPPNEAGYCSLGVAVDVAREAMEQATLVVGEVNPEMPFTFGDTFVSVDDFDLLIQSEKPPLHYEPGFAHSQMNQVATNVASIIKDGDCLSFSHGALFDALVPHLMSRKNLGIHSLYFTDALATLVKSGAVTNSRKSPFRGKSLTSYALGSKSLMKWLDRNPLVEFQGIDWVCNPGFIGSNPQFVALYEARKADLLGGVAFPLKGSVVTGPGEVIDFIKGAEISQDGCTIMGLPSRNLKGESNILLALMDFPNQLRLRESVHMIVTEYGIANLKWRPLRERAQAMIDIAHPDDRELLMEQARNRKIIYANQIFISRSVHLYPAHISTQEVFKGDVSIRFRAMKPSDEEAMRRFFYRCSDEIIYYRFFYSIKTMDHDKMQEYVNVDYSSELSIVGLTGKADEEQIVAEGRFFRDERSNYGEVAFLIEETFQGIGVGTYMLTLLIQLAREQGLKGLSAEVIADNQAMLKVFQKAGLPMDARLENGVYKLVMHFKE